MPSYVGHTIKVEDGESKGIHRNHKTLLVTVEVNAREAEKMKRELHHVGNRKIKLQFGEEPLKKRKEKSRRTRKWS